MEAHYLLVKGGLRALVIDANRDVADSLVFMLEIIGVAARAVYDGPSGIAVIEELKPDIVFIDIGMPRVNGYETARRICQCGHEHKITLIALTGWMQEKTEKLSLEAGFDLCLTKPASMDDIKAALSLARKD